jgi:hypothetical protein
MTTGASMAGTAPFGRNPFGPIEPQTVLAELRAAGTYDPDVLYSIKTRRLAPYRDLRRLAILGAALAVALLLLAMPVFCVLGFFSSAILWRYQAKQAANVESAFAEYLASGRS